MEKEWLVWVEVLWWYDWISHWVDKEWNMYSRRSFKPMEQWELCKYWYIYKVIQKWDHTFEIISKRED